VTLSNIELYLWTPSTNSNQEMPPDFVAQNQESGVKNDCPMDPSWGLRSHLGHLG